MTKRLKRTTDQHFCDYLPSPMRTKNQNSSFRRLLTRLTATAVIASAAVTAALSPAIAGASPPRRELSSTSRDTAGLSDSPLSLGIRTDGRTPEPVKIGSPTPPLVDKSLEDQTVIAQFPAQPGKGVVRVGVSDAVLNEKLVVQFDFEAGVIVGGSEDSTSVPLASRVALDLKPGGLQLRLRKADGSLMSGVLRVSNTNGTPVVGGSLASGPFVGIEHDSPDGASEVLRTPRFQQLPPATEAASAISEDGTAYAYALASSSGCPMLAGPLCKLSNKVKSMGKTAARAAAVCAVGAVGANTKDFLLKRTPAGIPSMAYNCIGANAADAGGVVPGINGNLGH